MSKSIIPFETDSGDIIYIEAEDGTSGGPVTRGGGTTRSGGEDDKPKGLDKAMGVVSHVGNQIVSRIKAFDMQPDEVTADIGIRFSASTGAFLASASSEATINLTLTWRKKQEKKD